MLKTQLLHPEILEALGRAGHGSKILIADGNYPFSTRIGPQAVQVNLNLSPDVITCTQALEALMDAVPIESATIMDTAKEGPYAMSTEPDIWGEFDTILRRGGYAGDLERLERFAFYEAATTPEVALTIATAERRIYANLLLTIGVVMP